VFRISIAYISYPSTIERCTRRINSLVSRNKYYQYVPWTLLLIINNSNSSNIAPNVETIARCAFARPNFSDSPYEWMNVESSALKKSLLLIEHDRLSSINASSKKFFNSLAEYSKIILLEHFTRARARVCEWVHVYARGRENHLYSLLYPLIFCSF